MCIRDRLVAGDAHDSADRMRRTDDDCRIVRHELNITERGRRFEVRGQIAEVKTRVRRLSPLQSDLEPLTSLRPCSPSGFR